MPKGKRTETVLPNHYKIQTIAGKEFIELRNAAKLAGVHPAVLEMGQILLKNLEQGGVFMLASRAKQEKATEIDEVFRSGLKKVIRSLGPGGLSVKSLVDRDNDRIVFWLQSGGPGIKRKAA